jgi:hypothetical protein
MNLKVKESEKSMLVRSTDKIVIRKIVNPITGERLFSVVNENSQTDTIESLVTNNIVIDGVKLDCAMN